VGEASGHAARHSVHRDASDAHIEATFASPWIARSLSVGPMGLAVGAFFDHAVADGSHLQRVPMENGHQIVRFGRTADIKIAV
jgi:hypothetical protein